MDAETYTQREAAAAMGVSLRQFVRYARRHSDIMRPIGYTGLVPIFRLDQVQQLRQAVLLSKLESLKRLSEAKTKAAPTARVVSMRQLRAAREKAGQ